MFRHTAILRGATVICIMNEPSHPPPQRRSFRVDGNRRDDLQWGGKKTVSFYINFVAVATTNAQWFWEVDASSAFTLLAECIPVAAYFPSSPATLEVSVCCQFLVGNFEGLHA